MVTCYFDKNTKYPLVARLSIVDDKYKTLYDEYFKPS